MTEKLILRADVRYADVDRRGRLLLPGVFKLLQEAAIVHANEFGTGTHAMDTRAETWVLNRMIVAIDRYAHAGETLRIETWSSGIRGFKGFRDFRVYDAAERPVIRASSLWVYVSTMTNSIVRVPRELAEIFPVGPDPAAFPELETWSPGEFGDEEAVRVRVSVRHSDFDVNQHVNNAAYLDFVQTALAGAGGEVYPQQVRIRFSRAIPPGTDQVEVRLQRAGAATRFRISVDGVRFAEGDATGAAPEPSPPTARVNA